MLPALAGYLILTLVLTWPIIADLQQYVISEYLDAATAFENLWWFHRAVCVLHTSPWFNPLINFPDGYSMIFFPIWVPYDFLALPFLHFLGADGLAPAFNLISLFSMVLSGLAMFIFVRYLTKDSGAAFVAGLALAFAPYRFWNLTRWHVTCLELVVLALYFFLRLLREHTGRAWLWFAVVISLLAYTSPNYAGDMIVALGMVLVFILVTERGKLELGPAAKRLALSAALAVLICLPLLIRLVLEVIRAPVPLGQPDALRGPFSANLLGFFLPGFNLRAYAFLAPHLPYPDFRLAREHGIAGYEIFMGWTVLIGAAVGAVKRWRNSRLFLFLAAMFILLSLGPALHVGAHTFTFPTPYRLLAPVLPWLTVDRTPVRHSAAALVAVIALAGMGISAVTQSLTPRRRRMVLVGIGAVILLEFNQAPLAVSQIPVPGFVEEIRKDPAEGSVLPLPFLPDMKRLSGFYQMRHGKPLAFQLTSRVDDPAYQHNALFRYLDHPRIWLELTGEPRAQALQELRAEMSRRQVRWLEVYPKFMEPPDMAGLKNLVPDLFPEATLIDDANYFVVRLGRESGR